MRKFFAVLFVASVSLVLPAFSCAQNGPTPTPKHSVALTWTNPTAGSFTFNCVYRGSTAGTYTLPALFCSTAPIASYTDNTVAAGTTYHYAVTASAGVGQESQYSNDVTAAVPSNPIIPNAPAGLATGVIALLKKPFTHGPELTFKSADGKLTATAQ